MVKRTIAIVEDDEATRLICQRVLVLDDYDVELCGDLQSAKSLLASQHIDLILLDLSLPDGDGLAFLNNYLADYPNCKVLIMTVKTAAEDRFIGFEAGAHDYLSKPFHTGELIHRVNSLLNKKKQSNGSRIKLSNCSLDLKNQSLISQD